MLQAKEKDEKEKRKKLMIFSVSPVGRRSFYIQI